MWYTLTVCGESSSSWRQGRSGPALSGYPVAPPHTPSSGRGLELSPPPGHPHRTGRTGTCP